MLQSEKSMRYVSRASDAGADGSQAIKNPHDAGLEIDYPSAAISMIDPRRF